MSYDCTEPWIETYTSQKFELLDPKPEQIVIEDIAHALANQCRFTGHTKQFYSVAEHSYHVSILTGLDGLLHDASEAYLCDLSRPLKQLTPIGPPYYEIENGIMRAMARKFEITWPMSAAVKDADNALLFLEKEKLMGTLGWEDDKSSEDARKRKEIVEALTATGKVTLRCWGPVVAEKIFLQRYYQLT